MKKIMMAAAVVGMAIASQAANCKWGSTGIYVPVVKTPASGEAAAVYYQANASTYAVQAYVFEFANAADYSAYSSKSSADLYAAFTGDGFANSTAADVGTTSAVGGAVTVTGKIDYGETDKAYAVIIYTFDQNKDGTADFYYAAAKESAEAAGLSGVTTSKILVTTKNDVSAWQSVPEPTSGLLLLLGVAGLALRRRRA